MFLQLTILAKKLTLGKNERLKRRKIIEQLFKEGQRFSVFPYRVFYLYMDVYNQPLQAGFSVSNRNFKKAVDRNRIKRLTKEAYRLQKNELQQKLVDANKNLVLFFIYTAKELSDFKTTSEKTGLILKKIMETIR